MKMIAYAVGIQPVDDKYYAWLNVEFMKNVAEIGSDRFL